MSKANGKAAGSRAAHGKRAGKTARAGGFAFARPVADGFDPLEGVMDMGSRLSTGALTLAIVAALVLHAGAAAAAGTAIAFGDIFAWANDVRGKISAKLSAYEVEVAKEPDPPPPEPPKEEVKEEPKDTPPPPKDAPKDEPPPPPAAAQAGAVITQEPAKDEPVDLTGNTFVTGSGSTFAGGTTQAGGTSTTAVYNAAAVATGVVGGTGKGPSPAAAPKVDRSRTAKIANLGNLSRCPFPAEADSDQIDEATVSMEVKVSVEGRAEAVTITQDPGHGFGREAKKCALREKYDAAWNAEGQPIPGTYRVRFNFTR